ncbi:unnamed protein product [Urochloa humidicola]
MESWGCCTAQRAQDSWRSASAWWRNLGGDANMTAAEGVTPFMTAAQSGDVSTVKYLLDRGGDLMKADDKGRTVLHHMLHALIIFLSQMHR